MVSITLVKFTHQNNYLHRFCAYSHLSVKSAAGQKNQNASILNIIVDKDNIHTNYFIGCNSFIVNHGLCNQHLKCHHNQVQAFY